MRQNDREADLTRRRRTSIGIRRNNTTDGIYRVRDTEDGVKPKWAHKGWEVSIRCSRSFYLLEWEDGFRRGLFLDSPSNVPAALSMIYSLAFILHSYIGVVPTLRTLYTYYYIGTQFIPLFWLARAGCRKKEIETATNPLLCLRNRVHPFNPTLTWLATVDCAVDDVWRMRRLINELGWGMKLWYTDYKSTLWVYNRFRDVDVLWRNEQRMCRLLVDH